MELLQYACALLCIIGHVMCSDRRFKRQIVFPTEPQPPAGNDCFTNILGPGTCIRYTDCVRRVEDFVINRHLVCGYFYNEPRVCCPINVEGEPIRDTPKPQRRPITRRPSITRRPTRPTTRPTVPPSAKHIEKLQDILPKDCGKTTIGSTRIVGGSPAEIGAWPWVIALYINGVAECGGALITSNYAITAAHCVHDGGTTLPASAFVVRVGAHNLVKEDRRSTPQNIGVSKVIKNPNFVPATYENDIAVLKLKKSVQFRSQVKPICLPYDDLTSSALAGRQAFVAGWGLIKQGGTSSPVLRQVQVPIWEQAKCTETYKKDAKITSASFCAGYAEGGKDSCQGDSGGPLMLPGKEGRFYLMGLVSYGKGCALPNFPGIYTNVRDFLPWISENMD